MFRNKLNQLKGDQSIMENNTNVNELAVAGLQQEVMMVSPDGKSMVVRDENGKFKRKAIFQAYSSVQAETREQKLALFNLLESDDIALPMGDNVGKQIKIADVIHNPYDAVDEDTGELTNGVLTYLIEADGTAYVTSSKSVYYTLQNAFKAFGAPHYNEGEELNVEIVKKKGREFQYVDVKILG